MNAESCSNCRFSIEEWKCNDVDENDVKEMACYVGPGLAKHERNLFFCRRYPPSINLSGYTVRFVKPSQNTVNPGLSDDETLGLEIEDDAQRLGISPLTMPEHWCGEWSSR